MWRLVCRRIGYAIGGIFFVLGLVDVPDQFKKWRELMVAMGMTGETGRWVLVFAGLLIIFIVNDAHRKLWRWINPKPLDDVDRFEQTAKLFWPKEPRHTSQPPVTVIKGELRVEDPSPLSGGMIISSADDSVRFGKSSPILGRLKAYFNPLPVPGSESSDLDIKYEDSGLPPYLTREMETENGQQVNVQRSSILITNVSNKDMTNVRVILEKVMEDNAPPGYDQGFLGYELPLQRTRLSPNDPLWMPLVSYRKGSAWFSLEGVDTDPPSKKGKVFRPHIWHELHVMVRADGGIAVPARFRVQVDDIGLLVMTRSNPDTPACPNRGAS